jgi:hypothetical protein
VVLGVVGVRALGAAVRGWVSLWAGRWGRWKKRYILESMGFGVGARRRGVGGWVVYFGGFAVGTGVEAVDGVEEEGGGGGEDDIAIVVGNFTIS